MDRKAPDRGSFWWGKWNWSEGNVVRQEHQGHRPNSIRNDSFTSLSQDLCRQNVWRKPPMTAYVCLRDYLALIRQSFIQDIPDLCDPLQGSTGGVGRRQSDLHHDEASQLVPEAHVNMEGACGRGIQVRYPRGGCCGDNAAMMSPSSQDPYLPTD